MIYRESIAEELLLRRITGSMGNNIRIGDFYNLFFPYEFDGFRN